MIRHPLAKRSYRKMWNPIYFFVVMIVFMMVSQPVFATDVIEEKKCEMAISAAITMQKTISELEALKESECKGEELEMLVDIENKQRCEQSVAFMLLNVNAASKEEFNTFVSELEQPAKCTADEFEKIKQDIPCRNAMQEAVQEAIKKKKYYNY